MRRISPSRASGFTLIEMVVSLAAASVLMVGLSSTIFIALRASDRSNTPTGAILEGHTQLSDMAVELRSAQAVSEQTATAITVTVPDREDVDTNAETIRYAWSGIPGDPLTRQYNGGTVSSVADDVHDFGIQYYQPASAIEYLTVWIQITGDVRTNIETTIPLLNRP